MFYALRMLSRLFKAARILASKDVLPPQEWSQFVPKPLLLTAKLLRGIKPDRRGRSGERLANAFTQLGPSYIKVGQFLATRPDVIGVEIAKDLSELQDRLPPFSKSLALQTLATELGPEKCTRLGDIGEAIAAASIAQVHKVVLKADDQTKSERSIALKILRPGVDREFANDLEAFAWAARQVEKMGEEARRMKPVAGVETLARSVMMEMDLRLEAAAASEMSTNSTHDPGLRIPTVEWDLTSKRVLATEWIDGTPLRNREELLNKGHDVKRLATLIIQIFLKHALRDGFFHADMHPGNLFVDASGNIVIVDFGIMGRLDRSSRRFMAETLAGFLSRDYKRVAQVHLDVGFVPSRHSVEDFAQALRAIGEPIFGRPASTMSMAKLLAQLFEVTHMFDMQMQPQLVMLQKTMVVVEGVARQLDPEHSIWDAARPVIENWMIESIGPQARLQDATHGLATIGRALSSFPDALRSAEKFAADLTEKGVKIHPDSAKKIAESEASTASIARWSLIASAIALALAAAAFI